MIISPWSGLRYPAISLIKVDLPHPDGPTSAVFLPHWIWSEKSVNTGASSYAKDILERWRDQDKYWKHDQCSRSIVGPVSINDQRFVILAKCVWRSL